MCLEGFLGNRLSQILLFNKKFILHYYMVLKFKELCSPSKFYFAVSFFFLISAAIQNIGYSTKYHLGHYSCAVSSTILIFAFKLIYILFWTWILNLVCKDGHKTIAWLLVLFPVLLMFVLLGTLLLMSN
jgi:hypothetical protein